MQVKLPRYVHVEYNLMGESNGSTLIMHDGEPHPEDFAGSGTSLEWIMQGADTLFRSGAEIVTLYIGGTEQLEVPYKKFIDEAMVDLRDNSNRLKRVLRYEMDTKSLTKPKMLTPCVEIDPETTKSYMEKRLKSEE